MRNEQELRVRCRSEHTKAAHAAHILEGAVVCRAKDNHDANGVLVDVLDRVLWLKDIGRLAIDGDHARFDVPISGPV